jgi:hypothetical protein
MKVAILLIALLATAVPASAQVARLPSPAGNFRQSGALSERIPKLADDEIVCLVEKRSGRQICRTFAYWRSLNARLAARAGSGEAP